MQRSRLLSMEPKVYIFGSSLGLLSYFTAIYYPNCYVVGYEILNVLHEKATMLAREHNDIDNVEFQNQNMFTSDLSDADIVVLTSLCWDENTKNRVAKKIMREAPQTCCVVSYDSDSFSDSRMLGDEDDKAVLKELKSSSNIEVSEIDQMMTDLDKALIFYSMYYYPYSIMNVDTRRERALEKKIQARQLQMEDAEGEGGDSNDEMNAIAAEKTPFFLEDIISGATSWSEEQRLYLYIRS